MTGCTPERPSRFADDWDDPIIVRPEHQIDPATYAAAMDEWAASGQARDWDTTGR
ncbi:hypothetical protein GXB85_13600 [Cellulomonas sp. APG4]|uniref:hypothetical protein n=1 Tax=Cellulomonas sp. APG4 TaxID=1538656 RepID=UPI00137AAC16|nr:hypothetical protein [Cellulomonas sp. APG4]NCT91977.1 hypothetical protein [Cellulomonas sp. APG4]